MNNRLHITDVSLKTSLDESHSFYAFCAVLSLNFYHNSVFPYLTSVVSFFIFLFLYSYSLFSIFMFSYYAALILLYK